MFNGRSHNHITAVCAWHGAAYQNDFFGFAHLHHLKILHSHASITHVSGHTLVLPNAPRRGTIADRADATVRFRSVRRALPREVELFHHALETFAFRAANHIDEVAGLKLRNAQVDVALKIVLQAKFAHESLRFDSGLLEFTDQCPRHARFLLHPEPDLHRRITLILFGQTAQQDIIAGSDHGHRTQSTLLVVQAGHTNLLS